MRGKKLTPREAALKAAEVTARETLAPDKGEMGVACVRIVTAELHRTTSSGTLAAELLRRARAYSGITKP